MIEETPKPIICPSVGKGAPSPTAKNLWLYEISTVLVLSALSLWSVRPLLEEWGLFNAYRQHGVSYLQQIFPLIAMRPLHLVPSALQWLSMAGNPVGVGIVAAALMLLRYWVARWAISPIASPTQQWLFATSAAVLIGWPGLWLARFHPAQLSAIFFFIAFGAAIRVAIEPRATHFVVASLSVAAMLMTYQALALAVAALPIVVCIVISQSRDDTKITLPAAFVLSSCALGSGLALYAGYAFAIQGMVDGIYESVLLMPLQTQSLTELATQNITTAYHTVFLSGQLFPFASVALIGACLASRVDASSRLAVYGLACISLTPMLSLVYLGISHLRDPERTIFPAAVGVAVIIGCFIPKSVLCGRAANALVLAVLFSATMSAISARNLWVQQDDIVTQASAIVRSSANGSVAIIDETGRLGDVYTFLETTLNDAVSLEGMAANIIICTPSDVDRIHPDAARYPIPTTKNCEDIDLSERRQVKAADVGGRVVLSP